MTSTQERDELQSDLEYLGWLALTVVVVAIAAALGGILAVEEVDGALGP